MSRRTTINVSDDLYEMVLAVSKYYNKPQSYVVNKALETLFANLPRLVFTEPKEYLKTDTRKSHYITYR